MLTLRPVLCADCGRPCRWRDVKRNLCAKCRTQRSTTGPPDELRGVVLAIPEREAALLAHAKRVQAALAQLRLRGL